VGTSVGGEVNEVTGVEGVTSVSPVSLYVSLFCGVARGWFEVTHFSSHNAPSDATYPERKPWFKLWDCPSKLNLAKLRPPQSLSAADLHDPLKFDCQSLQSEISAQS
jgi:hypothetical protein